MRIALSLAIVAASAAIAMPADAQIGGLIKKKAEAAAAKAADAGIRKVECKVSDTKCIETAKAEGKEVTTTPDAPGAPSAGATASMKPGEGAWANYDFVPGEKPLFVEDFSKDVVGDFPRRFELKSGNMEIVEWQGGRYLRSSTDGEFYIPLDAPLPERFTLEFDYVTPEALWVFTGDDPHKRLEFIHDGQAGLTQDDPRVTAIGGARSFGAYKLRHARVMADGRYFKVYVDETRTANVPNASLPRGNKIRFWGDGTDDKPLMIANIRLAAGGKKLYDALAESGRVATQGIYFDTGSDRLKPESTPTLKEIGAMLNEHGDLKLTIEGHTDNVGSPASNKELSQKRAAAVRDFLVATYKIDGSRLTALGLGDTKPAAPNTTNEGRQQNRRVELVKN